MGGSPCLVVMGDNSCLSGLGFESWRLILDGHDTSSYWLAAKKEAGVGPFFKKVPKCGPVWLRSINRLIWWKLCSSNVVDHHCCFSGAGSCFAATVNRVQSDQMMLKYKIVQNVSKSYPRSSHSSFYTRERFFKKVLIVGASFVSNFVAKNFQK